VSAELIEKEIQRFLSTEEPEVYCLRGKWGIGKTFAWNRYLTDAKTKRAIALKHYSYVSLFGINSIDDLKYSIFENSVNSSDIGLSPNLDTLQSNTVAVTRIVGKKSLWFLQQLPLVKNYAGGLGPVWFLSVKKTIVCIDDIERRGKNLRVRDVLGVVSNLKMHKECKVLLILNDEALETEEEKKEFETYFDKVVDASLKFEPLAEECAHIALLQDTELNKMLAEHCVMLGISNIRIIKKIERSVGQIEPMVKLFEREVLRQAVQSLALFGWSIYEPSEAPPLEYLRNRRATDVLAIGSNKVRVPPKEAAWNAMLDAYRFSAIDEFDLALLDGIQNGFFDASLVQKTASELNDKIKAGKADSSFRDAWRMYHDSFANNQEQVLNAIYQAFCNNVQYITPLNLNGTVELFKELRRADQAAEMIKHYIESRNEDRKFFDLSDFPFSGEISDPDVIEAFKNKCATFHEERDPVDILLNIHAGWRNDDIEWLATLSVEEYYQILKHAEGEDLRKMIAACLQFDRIVNASEPMRDVSKRAKEALKRIGHESAINARRVKKYGVEVDEAVQAGHENFHNSASDLPRTGQSEP
jgi:hypothetical protein